MGRPDASLCLTSRERLTRGENWIRQSSGRRERPCPCAARYPPKSEGVVVVFVVVLPVPVLGLPPNPPPGKPANPELTPGAVADTDVAVTAPLPPVAPWTETVSPGRRSIAAASALRVIVVCLVSVTFTIDPVEVSST